MAVRAARFVHAPSMAAKRWHFVAWIAPEPSGYSIMPSTVRLDGHGLLSAVRAARRRPQLDRRLLLARRWPALGAAQHTGARYRRRKSRRDASLGTTDAFASRMASDPTPFGMRAKLSRDNGQTWGEGNHAP